LYRAIAAKLSGSVEFPLFEFKRPLLIATAARRLLPEIVGKRVR
jgi:hypothetical protein